VVWSGGETVGPLLGFLIFLVLAAPLFFVAFFAWGTVVPYGAILLAVALPVAVGAWERMGAERRLIQDRFGVYVSPEVLEELTRDPEPARRGQRRTVTVLFSDVRGSTTLSESLSPEAWLAQLNEYLSLMSSAIFDYDGYLDKFMGDGIMAVWNAFGTQPDHAELALGAARRMLELLAALNEHWEQAPDRTPFRIGIGLHSGEALVGNVGSQTRTQYTVTGDVVNTAARIEEMTKEQPAELLLSGATAALLPPAEKLHELGEVSVRGRAGTIRLYTVEVA
jgi:adenylate cyclase